MAGEVWGEEVMGGVLELSGWTSIAGEKFCFVLFDCGYIDKGNPETLSLKRLLCITVHSCISVVKLWLCSPAYQTSKEA